MKRYTKETLCVHLIITLHVRGNPCFLLEQWPYIPLTPGGSTVPKILQYILLVDEKGIVYPYHQ